VPSERTNAPVGRRNGGCRLAVEGDPQERTVGAIRHDDGGMGRVERQTIDTEVAGGVRERSK